jgi:ferredoxin
MNVSITFEPAGISGLVAQGTYLIDAARRLGVALGTGCTAGQGECPTCLVVINSGADLLSDLSHAEARQLGNAPMGQVLRLACQTKIEGHGELVIGTNAPRPPAPTQAEEVSDIHRKFNDLPLGKKLATLVQFEAITMSQAFDSAIEKPLELGSKAFGKIKERIRPTPSDDHQNS